VWLFLNDRKTAILLKLGKKELKENPFYAEI
jgi:hypothetical protein